nr:MAG TPA: hypothetical protein [Caudoviricetes sp.]
MIYDYPEDFLAHHGIKGMRWGSESSELPALVERQTEQPARMLKNSPRPRCTTARAQATVER